MYRAIFLSSILAYLGCVTTPAAAGFAPMLTWNTCSGQGGLSDMTLPCSTGGDVRLVATFYTDSFLQGGDAALHMTFSMDIVTNESTLPEFWDFGYAPCPPRLDSYCGFSDCAHSPWNGGCILTLTYVARSELGANRIRILGDALQAGRGFALYRGVEYFLFDMDIHLDSAVEAGGSCSGCAAPVTIGLLTQVPLQNDPPVYFTCATANGSAVACSATPARNTTWGVLKSLYRSRPE